MRVRRKPVTSACREQVVCEGTFDSAMFEDAQSEVPAQEVRKYPEACEHILAAINSLAEVAQDDGDAKEAIANLSVVLLDLNG